MAKIIGRNFKLSIENGDGYFVPIGRDEPPREIIKGADICLTGTFTMGWVNFWKLQAITARPN